MITSLRLTDFKNFADEELCLGPLTVIVGTNASGKSNIRDAFRILHGIGRGYTLAEIFGGKYGTDWKPVRGGSVGQIARFGVPDSAGTGGGFSLGAEMQVSDVSNLLGSLDSGTGESSSIARFGIRILPGPPDDARPYVAREALETGRQENLEEIYNEEIFTDANNDGALNRGEPALSQIRNGQGPSYDTFKHARKITDKFLGMRFFDFVPDVMREPAPPGQDTLGDKGENLPVILERLCKDPKRKEILTAWIGELTPMDVVDFDFVPDASDRVHLVIREKNGRRVPAASVSDGTLRFLAMLAALFGEQQAGFYFFEEIENGIHPSRLHLLVELIERQTVKRGIQVVATTHSSDFLSMVSDETLENVSVVCRLEDTDDAFIRPLLDLPNAKELRDSQGLGRLLTGGWMETSLAFTEGVDEDDQE